MMFECVIMFVLERSRLLGGPSTCSGVVWVTGASGVMFGKFYLSVPCWSVFQPRSGISLVGSDVWLFYLCCCRLRVIVM